MSWSLFLEQLFSLDGSPATGDTAITIAGLSGNELVIEASNPLALPTWRVAGRVVFEHLLADFPGGAIVVQSYGRKVLLSSKCLIDVPPTISPPYTIKLLTPYWHKQMLVKLWQKSTEVIS